MPQTLSRITVLLVALASSASSGAQSAGTAPGEGSTAGKYPRPNLASAGQGVVRQNNLKVKFYQAVADDGSNQEYVVYEPPIRLVRASALTENGNSRRGSIPKAMSESSSCGTMISKRRSTRFEAISSRHPDTPA